MKRDGQFENLKGKGKPLNLEPSDPFEDRTSALFMRVLKHNKVLPRWIELQQEVDESARRFRARLREAWKGRSAASGSTWGARLAAFEEEARELNRLIDLFNLEVPHNITTTVFRFRIRLQRELEELEREEAAGAARAGGGQARHAG